MFKCPVCSSEKATVSPVELYLKADGRNIRFDGVPATVCDRCGERSYSAEAVDRLQSLAHDEAAAARTEPLYVYAYGDVGGPSA